MHNTWYWWEGTEVTSLYVATEGCVQVQGVWPGDTGPWLGVAQVTTTAQPSHRTQLTQHN